MTNEVYTHKYRIFRKEAANYIFSLHWLDNIQKNTVHLKIEDSAPASHERNRQAFLLARQIQKVNHILYTVEHFFGKQAREILYRIYVSGEKQSEIARLYGYSLRTLQRRIHLWLETSFEQEEEI